MGQRSRRAVPAPDTPWCCRDRGGQPAPKMGACPPGRSLAASPRHTQHQQPVLSPLLCPGVPARSRLTSPEQGGSAPGVPPAPLRISRDNPVLTWCGAGMGMADAQPRHCQSPDRAGNRNPRGGSAVPARDPQGGQWGSPPPNPGGLRGTGAPCGHPGADACPRSAMLANAATMRILIKGGKVVNDDCTLEADVYIENGIIQQVGRELMIPGGAKVIDATGKLVIPGGIDTSTHFHQTFMNATCVDDFYHGTKAALVGGTTMIIGHVLPDKETSLLDAYEKCRSLADPKVCCDYALHMGITWWAPKVKAEMETLVREKGVNSFQMFMTYKDLYMLRDSELYQVFRACRDFGAIARVHAENGELVAEGAKEALDLGITGPEGIEISRPEELEAEATHRVITIANRTHCPVYLVNVSSMSAGDVIAAAKMQGKVVYAETTTAHATLTGLHYYHQDWFHAAAYVTVPPLRLDTNTSAYLMSLLANDTLNIVASDHRPFSPKQKAMGKEDFTKIPHGVSGVQDRMNIIWERGVVGGKMDENRFVAVTSSNAAKIHNLYPRKGRIIPGADADVVVWDPEATKTISASTQVQGGDINLYENMRCHGVPLVTISRGRVVYENGVFMCAEGTGKFCPLRSFPDSVYKKLVQREKVLRSMTTFQSELRPGFSLPPEAGRAAFGRAGDLSPN
ncbi:dihydropyrimidinase-related protein 5 isoform X2 [Larus michahellis]|uniref:dihydropyrimidinase-related protein 5 isoform X2 n=2 Tax=Laridae TaxID=8910 RepID=UPI003D9B6A45